MYENQYNQTTTSCNIMAPQKFTMID